jgi:hypothetical protein
MLPDAVNHDTMTADPTLVAAVCNSAVLLTQDPEMLSQPRLGCDGFNAQGTHATNLVRVACTHERRGGGWRLPRKQLGSPAQVCCFIFIVCFSG